MAFGKLSVRGVLTLLQKKNPFEDLTGSTLADFKEMFQVELTGPKLPLPSSASSTAVIAETAVPVPSFSDISAPGWVLKHEHGFACGKFYTIKNIRGIYELKDIGNASLSFEEYIVDGRSNRHSIEVPSHDALTAVFKYKGSLPVGLPAEISDYMVHASNHASDEQSRAAAFVSLMSVAADNSADNDAKLFFTIKPNEAVVQCAFKKRSLKLVPATDSVSKVQIAADDWAGATIRTDGSVFAISPPSMPKTAKPADWSIKMVVSAYWWVASTQDAAEANMEKHRLKAGNAEVDIFTNFKPLKIGEKLYVLEESSAALEPELKKSKR